MGTKTQGSGQQRRHGQSHGGESQGSVHESSANIESHGDDGFGGVGGPQGANKMQIVFGGETPENQSRLSNKVRTTKYTLLTWAPLSLLFQFKRAANVYFLFITILTIMPFSPKKPASMIGTFTLVLVFTILKEAYEDYQRAKSDRELNNRLS